MPKDVPRKNRAQPRQSDVPVHQNAQPSLRHAATAEGWGREVDIASSCEDAAPSRFPSRRTHQQATSLSENNAPAHFRRKQRVDTMGKDMPKEMRKAHRCRPTIRRYLPRPPPLPRRQSPRRSP